LVCSTGVLLFTSRRLPEASVVCRIGRVVFLCCCGGSPACYGKREVRICVHVLGC
jgi:hypothetical protein